MSAAVRIIAPGTRRWSELTWYRLGVAAFCLVIFALLFTGKPVVLIMLVSALEAPVLALSAVMLVYLLHSRLAPEYRPGIVWHAVIVVGTLIYFALSVYALISSIGGFKW